MISFQIFELVTTKKLQIPKRAELSAADNGAVVVGGFIDKEEHTEQAKPQ